MAIRHSNTRSKLNAGGAGCLILFGVPFLLAGLAITSLQLNFVWKAWKVLGWVETPCRIEAASLKPGGSRGTSEATAEYSYRFGGVGYRSTQVTPFGGGDNVGTFQADTNRELQSYLKSGQPFRCFVNPSRPAEAVLYPQARLMVPAFLLLFALSFPPAGAGIMAFGWLGRREVKSSLALRAAYPNEPWRWKSIWSGTVIPPSVSGSSMGLLAYAIWSGLLIFPLIVVALRSGTFAQPSLAWLILIFPAIWILLAKGAFKGLRQRTALGRVGFEPSTWPSIPGGSLRGVVLFGRALPSQGEVMATLLCERHITIRSGDGNTTTKETVWSHESRVPAMTATQSLTGTRVPVGFTIPADAPETDVEEQVTKHVWKLRVRVSGSPLDVTFEVPVMLDGKSRDSNEREPISPTPTVSYLDDIDKALPQRLADSGLKVNFTEEGMPLSIISPPCRPKGAVAFMLFFNTIWTAAFVFMLIKHAPLLFVAVWGISSTAIWFSIIWMSLHRRTVHFDDSGLHIIQELGPFRRWEERIPRPQISGFTNDCNMNSGTVTYNRVRVMLKGGKTKTIVDAIEGSVVTQAVTKRLGKWLGEQN